MNTDLFLELTFAEVSQSQAIRTEDGATQQPNLTKYDRLADARRNGDR